MPDILVVPGSLRRRSSSRATARSLADRLKDRATFTLADPGKLPHYNADIADDPEVDAFIASVAAAHGVLFVTPEYNYSIPGVLKNEIDWASRPAYASVFKDKPCFLNGMLARVHPCKEVAIAKANDKVSDGRLVDEESLSFAETELNSFLEALADV